MFCNLLILILYCHFTNKWETFIHTVKYTILIHSYLHFFFFFFPLPRAPKTNNPNNSSHHTSHHSSSDSEESSHTSHSKQAFKRQEKSVEHTNEMIMDYLQMKMVDAKHCLYYCYFTVKVQNVLWYRRSKTEQVR